MATYAGKLNIGGTEIPIGSTLYGTCDSAVGAAAKVVTMANFDQLITGVTIHVKFTHENSANNPTLNVNGTGAKNIYRYGTVGPGVTGDMSWRPGAVVSFTYDGTNWIMNDINHVPIKLITTAYDDLSSKVSTDTDYSGGATITAVRLDTNGTESRIALRGYNISMKTSSTGEIMLKANLPDASYNNDTNTLTLPSID